MSIETLRAVANDLEQKGTVFYEIQDGFFISNRHAPQMTVKVEHDMFIQPMGDVLLRVFCDKGTVALTWPWPPEQNPVFIGSHIEVFTDGFPLTSPPTYTKTDPTATVWATYEILGDTQRKALADWSDPEDSSAGFKMRYGQEVWQIVGKSTGNSCLRLINPKND